MLKETDAKYKGKKFFVYVLETDYGHYVGHSGNTRARLRTHMNNEVPSTAGGHPKKIWQSQPLSTRDDAAKYEAALKSWRDNKKDEFQTHTGYVPKPFYNPNTKGRGYSPTSFSLMRFWRLSAMDIVKLVTVLLLMLYWFLR